MSARVLTIDEENLAIEAALTGQSLAKTAESLGFTTAQSFYNYRKSNPDFDSALNSARLNSCDHLEDQIIGLADSYESAHHARIKLESLAKVLSYRKPERYGNKVSLDITTQVDICSSLARMQARLVGEYGAASSTPIMLETKKPNKIEDIL